ncbi:MAG TPA: (2Fe-2S)-binding protein, partial [Clostridium sp.]|nr:(2Fe-2S)-binding protein [Clostridium sp.]
MVEVNIKINGIKYKRNINSMMRLIDFIRDEIK